MFRSTLGRAGCTISGLPDDLTREQAIAVGVEMLRQARPLVSSPKLAAEIDAEIDAEAPGTTD